MIQVAVVDDDPSFGRAFSRLLRAAGMRATVFTSAEEYLAAPRGSGFDCMVLDVQLGGMSGLELQRLLATSGETAPVVFLTALQEPKTYEEAASSGCPLLRKTDPGGLVLDAIRNAVSGRAPPFPIGQ
jgi:FixJ family two-component response regulator